MSLQPESKPHLPSSILHPLFHTLHTLHLTHQNPDYHKTLTTLTTASKTIRTIALKYQYKFLHIKSHQQYLCLLEVLRSKPERAELVRYISVGPLLGPRWIWNWDREYRERFEARVKRAKEGIEIDDSARDDQMPVELDILNDILNMSQLCPGLRGIGFADKEMKLKAISHERGQCGDGFLLSFVNILSEWDEYEFCFCLPMEFISLACEMYGSRTTHFHLKEFVHYSAEYMYFRSGTNPGKWTNFRFGIMKEFNLQGLCPPPDPSLLSSQNFQPRFVTISTYTPAHTELIQNLPATVERLTVHLERAVDPKSVVPYHWPAPSPTSGDSHNPPHTLIYIFSKNITLQYLQDLAQALLRYHGGGWLYVKIWDRDFYTKRAAQEMMNLLYERGVFEEAWWEGSWLDSEQEFLAQLGKWYRPG